MEHFVFAKKILFFSLKQFCQNPTKKSAVLLRRNFIVFAVDFSNNFY